MLNIVTHEDVVRIQKRRDKHTMSYRRDKRVNVAIITYIYSYGLPVAIGRTRDISSHGSFVETAYRPDSTHQIVDIEFTARNSERTEVYRVKAEVVHHCSEGIGVMIDNFNPQSSLPKLLSYREALQKSADKSACL